MVTRKGENKGYSKEGNKGRCKRGKINEKNKLGRYNREGKPRNGK
jgi:hypothetical protein